MKRHNRLGLEHLIFSIIIIAIFALSASCEVARYNECRRYHPMWYCVQGDSK